MKTMERADAIRVISEPGDATRYDYVVLRPSPDEFIFSPFGNTFNYPDRLNYFDIERIDTVDECMNIAYKFRCNPHTVLECIRTAKELWSSE